MFPGQIKVVMDKGVPTGLCDHTLERKDEILCIV